MQDNSHLCLWGTRLKYHFLKKSFGSISVEMDPKQKLHWCWCEEQTSGFPLNQKQDLGRKQLPVTVAGGAASSISPAPVIYCLSLWLPLLGSIDHKLAISILLKESREKVPEGSLLIFMGFFSAFKIHSQHQTAQNIPHKRNAHPQTNNKNGY